jgi:ubiquinone/menaquinone biosynthesis C-methylase UbiE
MNRSGRGGTEPSVEEYAQRHPQLGLTGDRTTLFESALRLISGHPGIAVDVGCGEGRSLALLDGRIESLGIDLSLQRAKIASTRGASALVADTHQLPLDDGSASLVLCRHVIEHVVSDTDTLREIRRILDDGGLLYLETPLRLRGAWYFYRNRRKEWVLDPTHEREYRSIEQLASVLTDSGLTPVQFVTRPITFPLLHVLHRVMSRNRPPRHSVGALLEKRSPNLRVPRYREMQVLARPARRDDLDLLQRMPLGW